MIDSRVITASLDADPLEGATVPLRLAAPDDYELGAELARGGMGQIVRAVDRRHDRPVAIKRPLRTADRSVARFVREARVAARLLHPGIVRVYEVGLLPTGEPFIAMQFVDGRSLTKVVQAAPDLAARLALVPRVIAAAEALAHAHAHGVVHRDVTPNNILVGAFGETLVIDWGVAKEIGARPDDGGPIATPALEEPRTRGPVGTPRFIAPEQARGAAVDARADVYSLGAVLSYTLTGRVPEPTEQPLDAAVPRALAAVVARAMAEDPADRYPSAVELAADLERFVTGGLVRAHAYTLGNLLGRWARRRTGVLVALGLALAAVLAIATWSFARVAQQRDAALAAQRRAERLGASGERLVDYLIDRLAAQVRDLGRLDALEGLGDRLEAYDAALAQAPRPAPGRLQRHAAQLELLGDLERAHGDLAHAARLYGAAAALRVREILNPRSHAATQTRPAP